MHFPFHIQESLYWRLQKTLIHVISIYKFLLILTASRYYRLGSAAACFTRWSRALVSKLSGIKIAKIYRSTGTGHKRGPCRSRSLKE